MAVAGVFCAGADPGDCERMKEPKRTIFELVVVVLLGTGVGLYANARSPLGLEVSEDYFGRSDPIPDPKPPGDQAPTPGAQDGPTDTSRTDPDGPSADPPSDDQDPTPDPPDTNPLPENGTDAGDPAIVVDGMPEPEIIDTLQSTLRIPATVLRHERVVELYEDPNYQNGLYVFVDARIDDLYEEGHIPGAYHYNHFRKSRDLDTILAVCAGATKIVVYCEGGMCEDSEMAAEDLVMNGVDYTILSIYGVGFQGWRSQGLPIERGARNSGEIIEGGS